VISHHFHYDEELELGYVEARVSPPIVLPEVTLAPGDTFRVNVNFADGKLLKVVNGADMVGMTFHALTGLTGNIATTKTNDAIVGLDLSSYQNVLNTAQSGESWCSRYESTDEYWFGKEFDFDRSEGAIIDGSLFGDFTVEFTAPTTVGGEPFPAESYIFNSVDIKTFLFNTPENKTIFEVVPEPGTVFLLGLGGLALIRKRRFSGGRS